MIGLVIEYWMDTGLTNTVAWVLMALLILQLILQRALFSFIIAGLFVFLSAWMTLAFLSDAVKITELTTRAIEFILYGIFICGLLLTASVFMIVKYAGKLEAKNKQAAIDAKSL